MAGVNQVFSLADDFARTLATKADDAAEVIGKKIKPPKFSGLRFATKPIGDTVELSSMADVFTKSPINPSKSNIYSYIDDGILAFDGDQISVGLRDEMRERILSQAGLNDKNLALDIMDDINKKSPQLIEKSKYYSLGTAKLNKKTGEYIYLCENLKDMPDLNGLRGKTPLSNKGKGLIFRLKKKLKNQE